MSLFKKLIGLLILAGFFGSCSDTTSANWAQYVPDETPFIVIPARNATIHSVLNSQYVPLLDDVSSSSIALINQIDSTAVNALQLKSILLYPGTDQKLQPIWIAEAPEPFMENMEKIYKQLYGQQYYFFNGIPILKIRTNNQIFFAVQVNHLLLLSESSLGIENALRTYHLEQPGVQLTETALRPGSIIMNTPALETWITQQAKVRYYSKIQNAFAGTRPALLTVTHKDTTVGGGIKLTGTIPVSEDSKSTFIKAISFKNAPLSLDQYISFDAAAFAFFRLPPADNFPPALPDTMAVDSFLINNTSLYQEISNTLSKEFAMVMFAESGFRSVNERAFIRRVADPGRLQKLLATLADKGLIKEIGETYFVRSSSLSQLIGSKLSDFGNFYLSIVDEAVVIAPRRGLVEMIASDYRRRQVVVYEPFYQKINKTLPAKVSGLAIGGKMLFKYLRPYLKSNSYIEALTARFEHISISTQKNDGQLKFVLETYNIESKEKPYIENWFFPVSSPLSGPPIFADILGSANQEIIFATEAGKVYVFAADGSLVRTYTTQDETPIGSPVAYDWYNTGQKIILIAAGNKIFAWDESGQLLPNFPFVLNEQITTPLIVTDLNRNGLADIIVATANRKLHAINARNNPLFGWPVETNAVINNKPLITQFRGQKTIAAFASNAIHLWNTAGQSLAGFPRFIDAGFVGSPVSLNGEIIGAAADGALYGFGAQNLFADSLNTTGGGFFSPDDREVLSVSQSPLVSSPSISEQSRIAVLNAQGSVYLFNENGVLLLAKSIGQTPSFNRAPVIVDINNDNSKDIVILADYGRLYAWNIETGERVQKLPTAPMTNVTIGDIDGDGLIEIVAQTDEGVHSWTIN